MRELHELFSSCCNSRQVLCWTEWKYQNRFGCLLRTYRGTLWCKELLSKLMILNPQGLDFLIDNEWKKIRRKWTDTKRTRVTRSAKGNNCHWIGTRSRERRQCDWDEDKSKQFATNRSQVGDLMLGQEIGFFNLVWGFNGKLASWSILYSLHVCVWWKGGYPTQNGFKSDV